MKKIICALLILVLLCSCSSERNVKVVNRNLSYKAHIFYFGKEIEVICDIGENSAEYAVADGQIKGFTAKVNIDGIKVSFEGLEKDINSENLSVFSILYDVTSFFDGQEYKIQNDGGNYCIDGEIDLGKFRYCYTPSGLPISINFENGVFSANFYDITLKRVK